MQTAEHMNNFIKIQTILDKSGILFQRSKKFKHGKWRSAQTLSGRIFVVNRDHFRPKTKHTLNK